MRDCSQNFIDSSDYTTTPWLNFAGCSHVVSRVSIFLTTP